MTEEEKNIATEQLFSKETQSLETDEGDKYFCPRPLDKIFPEYD